jgi:hypothetical protein
MKLCDSDTRTFHTCCVLSCVTIVSCCPLMFRAAEASIPGCQNVMQVILYIIG